MRVCILGVGAIGGHLAARFWKGGAEVTAVARGAQLEALRRGPLRMVAPGEEIIATIPVTADPAELGPQDAVIVAVKAPALPAVAAAIGPLLGPDTAVLFAMNGIPWWYYHAHGGPLDGTDLPLLDPGGALRTAIGFPRALGGVVYSACTVTEPGVIHVEHSRNRLVIGEPDGSASSRLEQIRRPERRHIRPHPRCRLVEAAAEPRQRIARRPDGERSGPVLS
jgi:2-dehydropantoate 2-reductase